MFSGPNSFLLKTFNHEKYLYNWLVNLTFEVLQSDGSAYKHDFFFQATYHRCQNIWRIDWVDFGSHTFAFRTSCHSCFRHWHTLVERWVDNYFCKRNWWSPACRFHILDRSYNWAAYIDSTLKFKHRIIQWSYISISYVRIFKHIFEFHVWVNVSCSVVTIVKNAKLTIRGSPIVFAKIIAEPSFDQRVLFPSFEHTGRTMGWQLFLQTQLVIPCLSISHSWP